MSFSGTLVNILNSSYEQRAPYRKKCNRNLFTTYLGNVYSVTRTSYGPELFCYTSLKNDHSLIANFLKKRQPSILNDPSYGQSSQTTLLTARKVPIIKVGAAQNSMFFSELKINRALIQPLIISCLENTFNVLKLMFLMKKRAFINSYNKWGVLIPRLTGFGSFDELVFGAALHKHRRKKNRGRSNLGKLFLPSHVFRFKLSDSKSYLNPSAPVHIHNKAKGNLIVSSLSSTMRLFRYKKSRFPIPMNFYSVWSKWKRFWMARLFKKQARAYAFPEFIVPFLSEDIQFSIRLKSLLLFKYIFSFNSLKKKYLINFRLRKEKVKKDFLKVFQGTENRKKPGFNKPWYNKKKFYKFGGKSYYNKNRNYLGKENHYNNKMSFNSGQPNKYNKNFRGGAKSNFKPFLNVHKMNDKKGVRFFHNQRLNRRRRFGNGPAPLAKLTPSREKILGKLLKSLLKVEKVIKKYEKSDFLPLFNFRYKLYKRKAYLRRKISRVLVAFYRKDRRLKQKNIKGLRVFNPNSLLQGIRPDMPFKFRSYFYINDRRRYYFYLQKLLGELRNQRDWNSSQKLVNLVNFLLGGPRFNGRLSKIDETYKKHWKIANKKKKVKRSNLALVNLFNRSHLSFLRSSFYDYLRQLKIFQVFMESKAKISTLGMIFYTIIKKIRLNKKKVVISKTNLRNFLLNTPYSNYLDLDSLASGTSFKPSTLVPSSLIRLKLRLRKNKIVRSYFLQKRQKFHSKFPRYNTNSFAKKFTKKQQRDYKRRQRFYRRQSIGLYKFSELRFEKREICRLFTPFSISKMSVFYLTKLVFKNILQYRLLLARLYFVKLFLRSNNAYLGSKYKHNIFRFNSAASRSFLKQEFHSPFRHTRLMVLPR